MSELEWLAGGVGHQAAYAAEGDGLSAESAGKGLDINAAAQSRLTACQLRR
ncbi:hypothetical protein QQY24_33985 [Streptomyces sp. TG1A-8]|uniref:hypothetical protein n=1 Tax=Streptomyces sp. TG1A-8 TaxID=3051385 RepID=UPI00265C3B50|nr:hypothetical protein [Streptomyces sp. TG1A-8]MDO0930078.1 hypothetical protein [Streptomyces sp. TG1A-8]